MPTTPTDAAKDPAPAPARRFAPLAPAIEDDWAPALVCAALGGFFLVLGLFRASAAAYAMAGLFAMLVLILIVMNMTARRIR